MSDVAPIYSALGNDMVTVVCPVCNGSRQLKEFVRRRRVSRGQDLRCSPCANKARSINLPWVPCRHCSVQPIRRPKGLCWTCYYAEGVRDLYPSTSRHARRGVTLTKSVSLPPTPTTAPPGSPEKIAVLEARAQAGQVLFHPKDSGYGVERRSLAVTNRRVGDEHGDE